MLEEVRVLISIILSIAAVVTLLASFFTVNQCTTAIVQRFGSFLRAAGPGLHLKVPFADRVVGSVNLRAEESHIPRGPDLGAPSPPGNGGQTHPETPWK